MRDTFDRTFSTTESVEPNRLEVIPDDSGRRRQYTVVPANADDHDRVTTWITVDEQSLLELTEMR